MMKVVLFLILAGLWSSVLPASLKQKIKDFETANSLKSAVILMDAVTGKITFIYNEKLALTMPQPPGSLMKVFSAGTLLDHRVALGFKQNKNHNCKGHFHFKKKSSYEEQLLYNLDNNNYQCSKRKGHGKLGLSQAIMVSCNSFFLSSAAKRAELFHQRLVTQWHLNKQLGILPGNSRIQSYNAPVKAGWIPYSLSAIGEGYLVQVTPLKISQLYGSLFSGQPIMSAAYNGRGKTLAAMPVSNKTRADLLFALNLVTSQGTLKHIKAKPGIQILGGKTGSGTLVNKKFQTNGWAVIGFRHNKKLLVLTAFVNRGSGSREAAEVAQIALDSL